MATPKWKEALQKRKQAKDAMDLKAMSIPAGSTTMRVLPNPKDADELFYQDYGQHWIKSTTEKNNQGKPKIIAAPLCKARAYDEPCEYCEAISEALGHMEDNEHEFSDDDIKQLKEAQARARVLINAAVRTGGGGYEVKLVELSSTAFNALIDLISEYGEEAVQAEGGLDVVVKRTGTGMNTQYTVMPAKDKGADIPKGWEAQCADLRGFADSQVLSAARQPQALGGIGAYAGITVSAPALSHTPSASSNSSSLPPPPAGKFGTNDSVTDDALDDLDDELDEVMDSAPDANVEDAEIISDESEAPKQQASGSQDDDDLLAELDGLDDL